VPFYFINLLPTSLLYISILLRGSRGVRYSSIKSSNPSISVQRQRCLSDVLVWRVASRIEAHGCKFSGNKALGGHGGALSLGEASKGTILDCFFDSNAATAETCGHETWDHCGGGGAVSVTVLVCPHCTITKNSSKYHFYTITSSISVPQKVEI
jgi:hypothetical protein